MLEIAEFIGDNAFVFISVFIVFTILISFLIKRSIKKKFQSALGEFDDFGGNKSPIKNGIPTLGILKAYEQTGVFINEQPQIRLVLDVLDENGDTFTGEVTEIIPLTDLHQLKAGMPFSVIYDQTNPKKMGMNPNPDNEKMQDLFDRYEAQQPGSTMSYAERAELRKRGQTGLALVKNIDLTGKTLDEKVETNIEVEITKPSQEKIRAERTLFLEKDQLKMIHVGQHIDVIYLPGREDNFSISFDVS